MYSNWVAGCAQRVSAAVPRRLASTASGGSVGGGQLRLSLTLPHQIVLRDVPVHQVNVSTSDGDLGILAQHVPSILQLRPGVLEVLVAEPQASRRSFFVSGGFATMNADSTLQIAAMEAVDVGQLDAQAVAAGLAEAQKKVQATAGAALTDRARAEALIHQEVYGAMSVALSRGKSA